MFGLFKRPARSDILSETLFQLGWGIEIGANESEAIKASGVDARRYAMEVACLQLFSTLCAYLEWDGRGSIPQEVEVEALEKFYSKIQKRVEATWPHVPEMFPMIYQHIQKYLGARADDLEAASSGALCLNVSRQFVQYLSIDSGVVSFELMPGASRRFFLQVEGTQEALRQVRGLRG